MQHGELATWFHLLERKSQKIKIKHLLAWQLHIELHDGQRPEGTSVSGSFKMNFKTA